MAVELPKVNTDGYYEIRLESIGGLGANIVGKMLGEMGASYLKLNSASFSSYGSEKRGSPVKAFVRWSGHEILHNSPIEHPHMLVLFHEAMSRKLPVTAGIPDDCKIVVNTDKSPGEIREMLKLHAGTIYCVDAQALALKSKSRVNMVMMGAIAMASGFIPIEAVESIVRDTLGVKYPSLLENNLAGIKLGFDLIKHEYFAPKDSYPPVPYKEAQNAWGYDNAPIGGVVTSPGNIVSNDLSASREGFIPLFIKEKCINCGLCDTTCPDMVFQFVPGEYKGKAAMINSGLDYHHCKGCMRCVDICPTGALVDGIEREHPEPQWFRRNKDLIVDHMEFEKVGANSWVVSEAEDSI